MIARIILLLVALFGIQSAMEGFQAPQTPQEMSVGELQQSGEATPSFVHIPQIFAPDDGVCVTTTYDEIPTDEMYVPLVTAEQAEAIANGVETVVPSFFIDDSCTAPSEQSWIRGRVEQTSFDQGLRDEFKKLGIVVPENATLIRRQESPASWADNMLVLLLCLIAAVAAIIPFFNRRRWPSEKDLEGQGAEEVFRALYPIIRVHDERGKDAEEDLLGASDEREAEIVLLSVNCFDNSKRPSLAVLTNRRYILYRTHPQRVLRGIALLQQLIEKVPVVGGILSVLLTPFSESYELITAPQHKVYREVMGYHESELIAGRVPWKKRCDMRWEEVARRCRSVSVKKTFWTGRLEVYFQPRTMMGVLRAPPSFSVEQLGVRVAAARMIEIFEAKLLSLGCSIERDGARFEIDLSGVELAEA